MTLASYPDSATEHFGMDIVDIIRSTRKTIWRLPRAVVPIRKSVPCIKYEIVKNVCMFRWKASVSKQRKSSPRHDTAGAEQNKWQTLDSRERCRWRWLDHSSSNNKQKSGAKGWSNSQRHGTIKRSIMQSFECFSGFILIEVMVSIQEEDWRPNSLREI